MAKPYFQPVLDAIATQPDPTLSALVEICQIVEDRRRPVLDRLVSVVTAINSREPPYHLVPRDVMMQLFARMVSRGYCLNFKALAIWYDPTPGGLPSFSHGEDDRHRGNWERLIDFLREPEPPLLLSELETLWKDRVTALGCAYHELAEEHSPPPPQTFPGGEPATGFGTLWSRPNLAAYLPEVIDRFHRDLHALFQIGLDLGVKQLEETGKPDVIRGLQKLFETWSAVVDQQKDVRPQDRAQRNLNLRTSLTQVVTGAKPPHRFLDAYAPHKSRTLEFSAFDRTDVSPGPDLQLFLAHGKDMRRRQFNYWLGAYGHPLSDKQAPGPEHKQRQALISARFKGRMKVGTDEEIAVFLAHFFEFTVETETKVLKTPLADARALAWGQVIDFLDQHLRALTDHTRFDVSEQTSYLGMVLPRAVTGGLIHDCGVYAVRAAFILTTAANRIEAAAKGAIGLKISWLLLPLHVGLLIESKFDPVFVHNAEITMLAEPRRGQMKTRWLDNALPEDKDPASAAAVDRKFLEDAAVSAFLNNVDMPLFVLDVPAGRGANKDAIWASFLRLMRQERLFSKLVTTPSSRRFQFDTDYLALITREKAWFNTVMVPLWNVTCKKAWDTARPGLIADYAKNHVPYVKALTHAVATAENALRDFVGPAKLEVSATLEKQPGLMLTDRVRKVFSERLINPDDAFGPIGKIRDHILLYSDPAPPTLPGSKELIVPPFAFEFNALRPVPI